LKIVMPAHVSGAASSGRNASGICASASTGAFTWRGVAAVVTDSWDLKKAAIDKIAAPTWVASFGRTLRFLRDAGAMAVIVKPSTCCAFTTPW
jgi:hypothetical protein